LPSAWSGYVDEHPAGASCLGPLAGLDRQREQYAAAVATLADGAQTTLVLVARAEASALREAARASDELAALGVANQQLIVNGVLRDPADDPTALAFADRQALALAGAPEYLSALPAAGVPLVAGDVTGVAALRQLTGASTPDDAADGMGADVDLPGLSELVDALEAAGDGVVMTMGKGGVGKTTLAAAIAVALVDRGHQVTLSTTDPAAHLTDALADAAPDGLVVERIDPVTETARYSAEVLAAATGLDDEGRSLLTEDLRSPCTEEIAVFRAFASTVDAARDRIVVLDTAPTGHTLLLLDAAHSYQREVARTNADVPAEVTELLARLRDPAFARMLVVTLPESTPVHEAERLQADLRRAGMEPFGWVVNGSLATRHTTHPTLRARAWTEREHIDRVRGLATGGVWLVGWQPEPPVGAGALRDLMSPLAVV
jgi:arsenite-transporting ATPase